MDTLNYESWPKRFCPFEGEKLLFDRSRDSFLIPKSEEIVFSKGFFPDELWMLILKGVDHHSLLGNVFFVNKLFSHLVFDVIKEWSVECYLNLRKNEPDHFGNDDYIERMERLIIDPCVYVHFLYGQMRDTNGFLAEDFGVIPFVVLEPRFEDGRVVNVYTELDFVKGESKIGGVRHYHPSTHKEIDHTEDRGLKGIEMQVNCKDLVVYDLRCLFPTSGLLEFNRGVEYYNGNFEDLIVDVDETYSAEKQLEVQKYLFVQRSGKSITTELSKQDLENYKLENPRKVLFGIPEQDEDCFLLKDMCREDDLDDEDHSEIDADTGIILGYFYGSPFFDDKKEGTLDALYLINVEAMNDQLFDQAIFCTRGDW